ncbi:MAG: TonB-dependent receptor domain-containing protein [Janthinobacterium lividum]
MKSILLGFVLVGSASLASAQSTSPAPATSAASGTGKLTGTVRDAAGQPVAFATVVLRDGATGKPVDGTACDEAGKFTLTAIAAGSYTLQVSFIGYQALEKIGLVFTVKGEVRTLGPLTLIAAPAQLGEVVVQGQRALVEEKVDRTVYNAEQDYTTQGGDAADVLRRVPLLSVDLDGNVSLRGSTNIKVLINSKPSTITAGSIADALKQLPADQIKAVEVITAPSARYDAEGSAGIINIITKQNNLQGKSLSLNMSAGLRGASLGLTGSYRAGRMGVTLGGSGRANYNIPGTFANDQHTYSTPGVLASTTQQQALTHYRDLAGQYTLGWTFDLSKQNALWASVRAGLRNSNSDQDELQTVSTLYPAGGGLGLASDTRTVRTADQSNTVDVSVGYTHTTAKPQQELSLLGLYSRNNRHDNFSNSIFNGRENGANLPDYRLQNLNGSFNQESTLQLDYQTPVGAKQLWEVGAKDIVRQVTSDYTYLQAAGLTGDTYTQLPNTNLSNTFRYRQNVAAGYAAATLTLPKAYTLKAGVRYEYTTIAATFAQAGTDADIPSYGVLVPSVNLARKLANGNLLKAAYTRRIQRPSLQFLNPNFQAANPRNPSQGNALLRPEYTANYELGYTTTLKGVSLTMSGFARTTTGSIQAVRRPVTPLEVASYGVTPAAILTTYDNIGQEQAYGGSLYLNATLGPQLTLNGGPDFYYTILRNNVPDIAYQAQNQGFVISGRLAATYAFTKHWSLQAFGYTSGREVQLQGYQTGFGVYSLSLRRTFADQRGSVGIGAENFFSPRIPFRYEYASPLLVQSSNDIPNRFTLKASFSYRLGKLAAPRPTREVSNDDLKDSK